ncbi:MAG: hypothetical protein U0904_03505, partial [Candidatus Nanopelagicales bacterium]|nr:hypothetical protein [Candidatus Nanopelagicales bacterium]
MSLVPMFDGVGSSPLDPAAGSRVFAAPVSDASSPADVAAARDLRSWWLGNRPGWVDAGWFDAPIRPAVLDLLTLPAGPALAEALTALGWGPCPADHSGEQMPGDPPLGLPGSPCACQVVLLAAWEAVASWVSAQQAHGLVTAAGPEPVIVPPVGAAPEITDPAREEIAAALHLSPASAANRIHAARELTAHPDLLGLVSRGQLPGLSARLLLADVANLDTQSALEVTAAVAGRVQKRWL